MTKETAQTFHNDALGMTLSLKAYGLSSLQAYHDARQFPLLGLENADYWFVETRNCFCQRKKVERTHACKGNQCGVWQAALKKEKLKITYTEGLTFRNHEQVLFVPFDLLDACAAQDKVTDANGQIINGKKYTAKKEDIKTLMRFQGQKAELLQASNDNETKIAYGLQIDATETVKIPFAVDVTRLGHYPVPPLRA